MTSLVLLGLHSVSDAENEDGNNDDDKDSHHNPDPNIETGLLNEGEGESGTMRTSDIGAGDSVSEGGNFIVSTVDSTGRSLKKDTSRKLGGNRASVLGTVDSGSVAEVGLLTDGEVLAKITNAVDGHRRAVVLNVGQMTASTHGLVSALVVLIAVLVGVSALNSTSEAILLRFTGSLESLGEQAQLSELEAVATAIRTISGGGGINLSVGALGSNQSVLVEASVVVEVVGLLSTIFGESLSFSFVKDGPTTTIVGKPRISRY